MPVNGVNNNNAVIPTAKNDSGKPIDGWFTDEKNPNDVSVDDFLNLMMTQLANQDFTNPLDDSEYLTQLAQFSTMQQMQELAYHSKSNYVMSLIGKDVTVARLTLGGKVEAFTGAVEKIALQGTDFTVYVDGKQYRLDQIQDIMPHKEKVEEPEDDKKEEDDKEEEDGGLIE